MITSTTGVDGSHVLMLCRLVTNRDIARALMRGGRLGEVEVTWRLLCGLSKDVSNIEELFAQR